MLVLRSHSIVVNARGVSRHVVEATRAWSNCVVTHTERCENKGKRKKKRKKRAMREDERREKKMRREKKRERVREWRERFIDNLEIF